MAEGDTSSPIAVDGQWKNTQADVDSNASHSSSAATRCTAPGLDDGEDTQSGNVSGSGSNGMSGAGDANKTQETGSRDDSSSSAGVQRAENAPAATGDTPEDEQSGTAFDSLQRNGPSESTGSSGHPNECKPCAFYCYSLRGCRNGSSCVFCHLFHESKLQQRREEWKRAQREKRGQMRKTAREEALVAESTPKSNPPTLIHHTAKANPASHTGSASPVGPAFVQGLSANASMKDPKEERPVAKVAYVREGQAAQKVSAGTQHSDLRTNTGANEFQGGVTGQKKPKKPPLKAQKEPLGMPMHVPAAWDVMNAPMPVPNVPVPNVLNRNPTMSMFQYTPSSVVVGVGQAVEIWPPPPIAAASMIFAVSPALPKGLALDKNTGLISGIAQEGTSGSRQYFVTACDPMTATPSIKVSMVDIKVINIQAPGYRMSSLVQPEPGVTVVTLREDQNMPGSAAGMEQLLQSLMPQPQQQQLMQSLMPQPQQQYSPAIMAKLVALAAQQEQLHSQMYGG